MVKFFQRYWEEKPLLLVMLLAIAFRLLAAIFAKGWGMFDDHFIVIESSGSWVTNPGNHPWLPGSSENHGPTGHNLFYPGFHYLLFLLLRFLGITEPQSQMLINRIILGAFSLITVYTGYRIAETLQGKKAARLAGLLLAILWFMPWMSVRNLVEMSSVPFIMAGFWMIIRERQKDRLILSWLLSGILFGMAVNIRPQTAFFPLGLGFVLLFQLKWRELVFLTMGSLLSFTLVQGGIDLVVWGKPFAELLAYVNVCITERNDYISLPWYNYFLTIFALLIPPVSIFLFFGFIKEWKKYLFVFFPVLLFFIFHSYFPNKQERFILPMIPLLIVFGSIGWTRFAGNSVFWMKHQRVLKWCWTFFWVINTVLLITFSITYSKKARVEAMTYLSRYPDIKIMAVIDEEGSPEQMPKFYLKQWPVSYSEFAGDHSADTILAVAYKNRMKDPPRFILFTGDKKIQPLVVKARKFFPELVYETTIEPGFIDRLVHWLNPINKNRRIFIYRNSAVIPKRIER
jgi:hypothetical protein